MRDIEAGKMEGIQTEYQRLESTDDVDHDERNVMLHVTDDTGKGDGSFSIIKAYL